MNSNRTVSGVHIGRLWGQVAMLRRELEELIALWAADTITPVIDSSYPFAEAAAAHRRVIDRQNTGKVGPELLKLRPAAK
jgi:synaptic vesicle membrane protein VAT-1